MTGLTVLRVYVAVAGLATAAACGVALVRLRRAFAAEAGRSAAADAELDAAIVLLLDSISGDGR